jgi:hypothetical protein
MGWAENVVRMGEMRNAYKILVRIPEEKDHAEDIGVDGRITLEWEIGSDACGSGQGPVAGCPKHGNEISVSIKGGIFID